jgi:hypothetical protein
MTMYAEGPSSRYAIASSVTDAENLTSWYSGTQKPARIGVYERLVDERGYVQYNYWTGLRWAIGGHSPDDAMKYSRIASNYQNVAWRGLTPPGLIAYEKSLFEARWKL